VFREPKGIPLKREVEHEIQLLPNSPLPNNKMYRKYVIEENKVNKKLQQLLDHGVI